MTRWATSLLVLAFLFAGQTAHARAQQAEFHFDVERERWKGARITGIPEGATIAVQIASDGPVAVLLMSEAAYARFPTHEEVVFRGETSRNLSFAVRAPVTSPYYLLIDNRAGDSRRTVDIRVRGESNDEVKNTPNHDPPASRLLADFERQLARWFVFEPFPVSARDCGEPRAFADESGIVLCREFAERLYDALGDREQAADALVFTLFHEIAHVLLEQWGYPMYRNEESADEFATAVMMMAGHPNRVRAKAAYFQSNPSLVEALWKPFVDDRHPLPQQRARNLLRWLDDPQLVRRWQKIFVPHLQTEMLESLEREPTAWSDAEAVARELRLRRQSRP